ncbi:MAG: hypothetical protein WBC52_04865 [Candidatus Omnitrophota bacterium]
MENENENGLPGNFEDVNVVAKLSELKGNKALYDAFKSEATIQHYNCIDFPDAIEHFGQSKALKAMKNELKTNAQDDKRRELQAELRKRLALVLGDPAIVAKLNL